MPRGGKLCWSKRRGSKRRQVFSGQVVDVVKGEIFGGDVEVKGGKIVAIRRNPQAPTNVYITPGFVDAHRHCESTLLTPGECGRYSVVHGTVAIVSDPHEIANVCGIHGVEYMLDERRKSPIKWNFGAPSCVPATPFETSGAKLEACDVCRLLERPDIGHLSELMNFPGVINGDPKFVEMIEAAIRLGKPRDGHAPGLTGEMLERYVGRGVQTDHECYSLAEALAKIALGMKVLIREGSAARNFHTLLPLISSHPEMVMFCTDDQHPDRLMQQDIDWMVREAIRAGCDPLTVFRIASLNVVSHYGMNAQLKGSAPVCDVGLLQEGDPADFLVLDVSRGVENFRVVETYIDGHCVARDGEPLTVYEKPAEINNFNTSLIATSELEVPATGREIRVIVAQDGELITGSEMRSDFTVVGGKVVADPKKDLLKIVVKSRYDNRPPTVAFIRGMGLKGGAIASSVCHDSHNIVAVGCSDEEIALAINTVIREKGGLVAVREAFGETVFLPLPIAGLMSDLEGSEVARRYSELDGFAKDQLGIRDTLRAPFMTLSFMPLLCIPALKLGDMGLFDGKKWELVSLWAA